MFARRQFREAPGKLAPPYDSVGGSAIHGQGLLDGRYEGFIGDRLLQVIYGSRLQRADGGRRIPVPWIMIDGRFAPSDLRRSSKATPLIPGNLLSMIKHPLRLSL